MSFFREAAMTSRQFRRALGRGQGTVRKIDCRCGLRSQRGGTKSSPTLHAYASPRIAVPSAIAVLSSILNLRSAKSRRPDALYLHVAGQAKRLHRSVRHSNTGTPTRPLATFHGRIFVVIGCAPLRGRQCKRGGRKEQIRTDFQPDLSFRINLLQTISKARARSSVG